MNAIPTIVCYPNLLPFEPTEPNVDEFIAGMKNAGITHVQVNHLPDLMHPEQLAQPDNVYLWFANFGPPLDLFVASKLNHGLWPEMYLERNRRTLLRFAATARRYGIKPLLYLCEPRFVPERFFQRHPTLRGPRVDNPTCSRSPLYALCTDLPEVQEHYREMMTKIMEAVPDLALASLFTSDSGAGFDYNPDTYAGPNGAGFNRGFPVERRVAKFLKTLLEAGQAVNPEFTINLTSGFTPETRAKILAISPPGVVGSVYGLYDWEGGLEEHWGYQQAVWGVPKPKWNVRTLDRKAAAAERFADMQERYNVAAKDGREPIVHAELPTIDYPWPLRYTPQPFETIRIMKDLVRIGTKKLAAWGVISPKSLVPYDVNAEAMARINANINAPAEEIVRQIAVEWVGTEQAGVLVDAWKQCDHTWIHRPNWRQCGLNKDLWLGPLVPDLTKITPAELAYFRTAALDDLERISGVGYSVPYESDERIRDYVVTELFETQTLPELKAVSATLALAATRAKGPAAEVFKRQGEHVRMAYLYMRTHYNWYDAGRYLAPSANPGRGRTMVQIVDDELQVTRDTIALLDGRPDQFLRAMPSDYMTHNFGMGLVGQMRQRIPLMEAHRNDPPRSLSDRLEKMHSYLKWMAGEEL